MIKQKSNLYILGAVILAVLAFLTNDNAWIASGFGVAAAITMFRWTFAFENEEHKRQGLYQDGDK